MPPHQAGKEVTDRAGLYLSTFYLYFRDIYDVLGQLEDQVVLAWEGVLDEGLRSASLETFVGIAASFYEHYGDYLSVLLSSKGDPSFLPRIKDILLPKMYSLLGLPEDDTRTALIFEFASSGILALLTGWYRSGRPIPAKDAVDLARTLLAQGVAPVILRDAQTKPEAVAKLLESAGLVAVPKKEQASNVPRAL